ncbi:hypothetical protein M405DRAFT_828226 [Rhizopogon salebrosus TDB-379]|nr:hypothetical protein M405DRAFT_828226 [Rhizopogon salebrosus TDB-379]
MFELIATGSGPLSRVYNDLALSPLSNSSPAAIAFAKPRAERFFRLPPTPTSDLEDICRDRYKSSKTSTLSGRLVPAGVAT